MNEPPLASTGTLGPLAGPDPAADDTVSVGRARCPDCQTPLRLVDGRADAARCPACGSLFHLQDVRPADGPRRLGKFELLERVGQGAFGAVWKARDTELDRLVAVKIPHAGPSASAAEAERFSREARAAAQLRHPGLVAIHEAAVLDGRPALITDFVSGVPLRDFLRERRPTFREAADLLAQIAEAMHYAHERGLVHRDLKPGNVMLEPGPDAAAPRARVVDFGLALRGEAEATLTADGQVLGTPAYMSPEQAAGRGHESDRRSDVYSLGIMLYEMLTGELPFRGSQHMILHQMQHEEPRPPRALNDRIPRDLETVCLKCVQKEPHRRYATAGDLGADLRRFLAGEPISARPIGRAARAWRWGRRNPLPTILGGTAVLALLAGTAVSVYWGVAASREAARYKAERERALAAGALDIADPNLPHVRSIRFTEFSDSKMRSERTFLWRIYLPPAGKFRIVTQFVREFDREPPDDFLRREEFEEGRKGKENLVSLTLRKTENNQWLYAYRVLGSDRGWFSPALPTNYTDSFDRNGWSDILELHPDRTYYMPVAEPRMRLMRIEFGTSDDLEGPCGGFQVWLERAGRDGTFE